MGPGHVLAMASNFTVWALLEAIGRDELLLLAELQQSNDAVKADALGARRNFGTRFSSGNVARFRHLMQHVSSITTGPYSPIKLGMISHVAFRVFRVKSRADRAQQRNISVICNLCFPISVLAHGKASLKKSCEDLQRLRAERKKLEVQSSRRGQISWNQLSWKCLVESVQLEVHRPLRLRRDWSYFVSTPDHGSVIYLRASNAYRLFSWCCYTARIIRWEDTHCHGHWKKYIYIQSRRFEPPSAYRPSPFHHEAKLRAVERQLSDVKKQDSALRGSVWAHDSRNSLN